MIQPPNGYDSHSEYLALGGVPRHIYFDRVGKGETPQSVVESYLKTWDPGEPLNYRGIQFRNYHLLCDHLESIGVLHKPTPRSEKTTIESVYDRYAERDVLMWLAGNYYLARPDADNYIGMVVAPFRREVITTNPRSRRFDAFPSVQCVKCACITDTKQRMIRCKEPSGLPFSKAAMRRDFDPSKYEVWCRSCLRLDGHKSRA